MFLWRRDDNNRDRDDRAWDSTVSRVVRPGR